MGKNPYIAYGLLIVSALFIGGGLHRIYCKRFATGFAQIGLFWLGQFTMIFLIGFVFLAVWGIWILFDIFLTDSMVAKFSDESLKTERARIETNLSNLENLFAQFQKGEISENEYRARKEIILNQI